MTHGLVFMILRTSGGKGWLSYDVMKGWGPV